MRANVLLFPYLCNMKGNKKASKPKLKSFSESLKEYTAKFGVKRGEEMFFEALKASELPAMSFLHEEYAIGLKDYLKANEAFAMMDKELNAMDKNDPLYRIKEKQINIKIKALQQEYNATLKNKNNGKK